MVENAQGCRLVGKQGVLASYPRSINPKEYKKQARQCSSLAAHLLVVQQLSAVLEGEGAGLHNGRVDGVCTRCGAEKGRRATGVFWQALWNLG